MATLTNVRHAQPAHVERDMRAMDDATLLGQELVQKGAIHALTELQAIGVTPENVASMLEGLQSLGEIVTAECKRRNVATVDLAPTIDATEPPRQPELRSVTIDAKRLAQLIDYYSGVLVDLMSTKFDDAEVEGVADAVVQTHDTITALKKLDRLICDSPPEVAGAIEIALLWRSGKIVGGDQDEVRNALLGEIERLRGVA